MLMKEIGQRWMTTLLYTDRKVMVTQIMTCYSCAEGVALVAGGSVTGGAARWSGRRVEG